MGKWTRRTFLTVGALAGGGLLLGVGVVAFAPNRLRIQPEPEPGSTRLTTWIKLLPDGQIIAVVPHCEMGQGAQTGLAMMLAEELDADWSQVRIEEAPAEDVYANGYMLRSFLLAGGEVPQWLVRGVDYTTWKISDLAGLQVTGGSASLRATGVFGMRIAGATARRMLLQAAAVRWSVPFDSCSARLSRVEHASSGRSLSFAELAVAAAAIEPEMHPPLKARADYSIVGTRRPRPDLPSKVDGSAVYAIDLKLPGMLYAAVRGAAWPEGKLASVDPAPALAVPGVRQVVKLDDAVAVVAESWWRAQQALALLEPRFEGPDQSQVDSANLLAAHREVLQGSGSRDHHSGDGLQAWERCAQKLEVEYQVPYLAHATMEPMCATAQWLDGKLQVWAGTQDPLNARHAAAKAGGLSVAEVQFHQLQVGGGYGRRLPFCFDYVEQAVRIAKALAPAPVKLIWSREQDLQHDYFRPMALAACRGGLDEAGQALLWSSHFTGPGEMGAGRPPYALPHQEIRESAAPQYLRTGSWRSVAFSQHGFFTESFVDELAQVAKVDPLKFRLDLLQQRPRHRAVLERVARMADWGAQLPAGQGLGIAVVECFGTVCAQVALVEVGAGIRVRKVWAAVDCGLVVNPDQALAQIQGGIVFGLSAALLQEITIAKGAIVQSSFPDYPSLLLSASPRIDVEFLESEAPLGGLGEPGVPPIAPAVANAVYAASGQRLRSLPLRLGGLAQGV